MARRKCSEIRVPDKELMRLMSHVEQGLKNINKMLDEVHRELDRIDLGITARNMGEDANAAMKIPDSLDIEKE